MLFRATPAAYGNSQPRGQIRAAAVSLHHSHSNSGSQTSLQPTPQLTAMLDPHPSELLELINEFSKVAGYKINIQKLAAFLYTNNEVLRKEYKNTILFKISSPKIKYLGRNLTKEVKDLYAENYKNFIKEEFPSWRSG